MDSSLREAERLIEEARNSQAPSLYLGDLELSQLPEGLEELPHLKELDLGLWDPQETEDLEWDPSLYKVTDLAALAWLEDLRSLSLSGKMIVTDLSPLAGLQRLQKLHLVGLKLLRDLSPLAGLRGLQSLVLTRCKWVRDLSPLAGLQGLQSLHLTGFKNVRDLSPLAGLQALQSLHLTEFEMVTNLAPLTSLQGLQSLELSNCTGVKDFTPLARLEGLQSLDLTGCWTLRDLSPLAGLQELQSLGLNHTEVTNLTPLGSLKKLHSLSLSNCYEVTDLSPLASLQRLQSLEMQYTKVRDLSPLAGFRRLKSLSLSGCEEVTDLAPLAGLQKLDSLDMVGCDGVVSLDALAELRALRNLNLALCRNLTDITPLAGLQGLRTLVLTQCPKVTDVTPLAGLQGLQSLDLSECSGVTNFAPLASLQGLERLDLARCKAMTNLSPLAELQGLQDLDLEDCIEVTDFSALAGLQGLRKLNLYGCRPISKLLLQAFADHSRLVELVVEEAIGIARDALSDAFYINCLPRVRSYLSELNLGAEAENEVKVILLGNGGVGKTQLCRRFRGEAFRASNKSTHGVEIWRKELRLQKGGEEKVFEVNWWDFGGQDIYHGTHALFVRSRAVFLILWNPALENREEYPQNDITMRNQPLGYWLDYVRSISGEDSPVIVVHSQCDRFEDRVPSPARPEGLGFFETCSYSAQGEELGREVLEAYLHDAICYLLARNGALEIGRGRAEVRRQLYAWRSEDQDLAPPERKHRTLTVEHFQWLCERTGSIVSWGHALDYFHHTGVVFYQPDLFSSRMILDQNWALEAVYTVFHRGRTTPWLRDSGRFTREDLALLVWPKHPLDEQRLFLGLMASCGICFPCGRTVQGEARYVAPDLLPPFETVKGRLPAWRDTPWGPTLRLKYKFFHPAVIRGLMSQVGREAGDLAEYWKYGLWLKDGLRDSQVLVQFHDISSEQEPGAGVLEVKAQGRDPLSLLREIRKAILQQRIGENPEEELTLGEGTTVARSALATIIDGSVLDIAARPVLAAPFVAFFEERELVPVQSTSAAKTRRIDIKPLAQGAIEGHPVPRSFGSAASPSGFRYDAFVSYRHGGADERFARDLVNNLEALGLTVAIDKRDFSPPATFVEEMERCVRESRFTLAVVSARYLNSGNSVEEAILCKVIGLRERRRRLMPLILEPVERPDWLYTLVGIDFFEAEPIVDPFVKLIGAMKAGDSDGPSYHRNMQ